MIQILDTDHCARHHVARVEVDLPPAPALTVRDEAGAIVAVSRAMAPPVRVCPECEGGRRYVERYGIKR